MRKISSLEDLLSISKNETVELTQDIDCRGKRVSGICSVFSGVLEGNNHAISNLVIEKKIKGDEQKIALFEILSHACIRNVRFENITFEINRGVYTPRVAGLGVEVTDSDLDNVTLKVNTSNGEGIPMIYDSAGCKDKGIEYSCNNRKFKIYSYKEDA